VEEQPEDIVIKHLCGLRTGIGDIKDEVQTLKAEMATKSDLRFPRAERRLRHAGDAKGHPRADCRPSPGSDRVSVGHGVIISELG
jgi:hypothetical protein